MVASSEPISEFQPLRKIAMPKANTAEDRAGIKIFIPILLKLARCSSCVGVCRVLRFTRLNAAGIQIRQTRMPT